MLLIDEIDRADEEFESFLLELLSDFQITIPEIGTLQAEHRPIIVITSNRTREIHDALKRRCVYHWIDYPEFEKEIEIVRRKVPELEENLGREIVTAIDRRETGEKAATRDIFTEEFLLKRPLLQAIDCSHERAPVLLIDEIDRADEEFESFLLELLSDFQITIPEIGTLQAEHRPIIVITSNRTREIHDALKRRCVYHWIDYPEFEKEIEIVRRKVPELEENLGREIVTFVQALRAKDLYKLPGVAETLDWAAALEHLNTCRLDPEVVVSTLGLLLKYQDDVDKLKVETPSILKEALG